MRKPDPSIYRHLLVKTGAVPADVIFVDDRQANVDAAVGLGMEGILFGPTLEAYAGSHRAADFDALLDLIDGLA